MEQSPEKHKWGILKNPFRFYQPLHFHPTSHYLLEFLIFFHIYILAAWLALREAWFDRADKRKIVRILQQNSEIECYVTVHHKSTTKQYFNKDANTTVYECDLIHNEQIILLANELKCHQFDVAIFAAGIMLAPEVRTSDGVELHNAVNVVGQIMLYELLQNECRRAVFLSSATSRVACFSKDPDFLSVYAGPYQAYASSKLNLAVYVNEVAKKRHVTAVCLHPGTVPGHLYKNANLVVRYLNFAVLPKLMRSPEMAALLVLHTIFREDVQPGAYYEDTEIVDLVEWMPEEERDRIYNTICKRIEMWMEH
ncbi:hypothetical protein CAEBREN_17328 [Caenorhabditis brenneri]|uniref:NAD-dependent epimerase/dehydratase domain-containing protein n=1 Tax=Caenorhabditis brenneri TaxID=135651 RepID=G0P9S2_CAEBE|nr:hypothetical protein CAEBREN_17328 [Caenorhabditis brenneri]